jgi:hypothetical protein
MELAVLCLRFVVFGFQLTVFQKPHAASTNHMSLIGPISLIHSARPLTSF